ncbi:MAG: hypothetical protein ACTHJL_01415 [Amnibacterium sp.]
MTAHAALPAPRTTPAGLRKAVTRTAIGALGAAVLVLGGLALHAAAAPDEDSTMTVAELDSSLSITAAGSRELDRVPSSVEQSVLPKEAHDVDVVRASGAAIGSSQRLGVLFTATDRAAAERLAGLLERTTGFTVAVAAPAAAEPRWTVAGITPRVPLTIDLAHQLTERMSEAAWASGNAHFSDWRVVSR